MTMAIDDALSVADFPLSSEQLRDWDGACLELVNRLLFSHPTGRILYLDQPNVRWRYHTALVLDGLVYDAWHPHARLPPEEYVREVFGEAVEWEIISDGEVCEGENSCTT